MARVLAGVSPTPNEGLQGGGRGGSEKSGDEAKRYVLRPPLAKSRLTQRPDGDPVIRLSRVWSDGTSAVVLTPIELIERLAAVIPAPRTNQILYAGVLAPRSAWRKEINPKPPPLPADQGNTSRGLLRCGHGLPCPAPDRRAPWADLLWRVFGIDGFRCTRCQARMRHKSVLVNPPATTKLLEGLAASSLRARPPPHTARGAG